MTPGMLQPLEARSSPSADGQQHRPWSWKCKKLNSVNNLNEQGSPVEPLERTAVQLTP